MLEKPESAEGVLTDWFTGAGIEDIDQHVLFGMAGEKAGKDFDELFLVCRIGLLESVTYI